MEAAFDTEHTFLPGFTPAEYHWDLGDGTVLDGPAQHHTYAAPGTYTVRLDLLDKLPMRAATSPATA